MSETWERESLPLNKLLNIEHFQIISNVNQRKERGGRPALIVKNDYYNVQNLTNTLIPVKWGVEAVWGLLTPKNVSSQSKIQHIACASIYSRPNSKNKSDLYDHIYEAYNMLNAKFHRGLHIIIAGDTNELNINPILSLSHKMLQDIIQQLVKDHS